VGDLDSIRTLFNLTPDHLRASRFITIGGQVILDRRDHKGQPSRGSLLDLAVTYNHGTGRSAALKFTKIRADISQYLNLWRKRLLALRVHLESTDILKGDRHAPFYLLSPLGGIDDLRGFSRNRYIDNDAITVSLEYRYPVWRKIDGFVFLDEGRPFCDITEDLAFEKWQYSFGGGLRVWDSDGLMLKTLVARSREETRFYFEMGAAW
jgi:outer membrane protein insertion porin family